jgi:hypothetical protein
MARALRFQYPGAIYHVMARGDGGKVVFENKDDCEIFLHRLGEACGSRGWRNLKSQAFCRFADRVEFRKGDKVCSYVKDGAPVGPPSFT